MPEGRIDAILTAVGRDDLAMFDADTFGALTGRLSETILSGYADEFQGAILDTMVANRFGSGGVHFGEVSGGPTSFVSLADAAPTEIVEGREKFSSLVLDGARCYRRSVGILWRRVVRGRLADDCGGRRRLPGGNKSQVGLRTKPHAIPAHQQEHDAQK